MSRLDWLDEDPWFDSYATRFLKDVLPMLQESDFSVSIAPGSRNKDTKGDVKYWVELGASIMYDKPIIVIIEFGQEMPVRLRRVADAVVEADLDTPEGQQAAQEQIAVVIAKLEEEGM